MEKQEGPPRQGGCTVSYLETLPDHEDQGSQCISFGVRFKEFSGGSSIRVSALSLVLISRILFWVAGAFRAVSPNS